MFCIYATINVEVTKLTKTLNLGIFGNFEGGEQWAPSPRSYLDSSVAAIVRHHRSDPGNFDKIYFIVADREDWESEGILAVNLDFEGFIDATRMKANVAGSAIPSVSIVNTEWYEALSNSTSGFYPKGRFAVYASEEVGDVEKEGGLLENLNSGLESRKDNSPATCRNAPKLGSDVDAIAKDHGKIAAEGNFDPAMFIVADQADWNEDGVWIVRIGESGNPDACRRPVDVAAEVLVWVHQGLSTWQGGKDWDDEKHKTDE